MAEGAPGKGENGGERRPHDSAYKYLFSSPRVVHQFLTRFVDEQFIRGLTPQDVRRFESSLVSDELSTGSRILFTRAALIQGSIPSRYIPSFEYFPVIERDIPDERLERIRALVAAVVYLEKRRDAASLTGAVDAVVRMLAEEQPEELRMFTRCGSIARAIDLPPGSR